MWWMLVLGLMVGGLVGFGWYRLVGCRTGTCPITSSRTTSILFGAAMGLFVALQAQASSGNCPLTRALGRDDGVASAHVKPDKTQKEKRTMAEVITSDSDFESKVLSADKPVLVDFYADWCGPCKFLAPVVEEMAKELAGKAYVYKINVDEVGGVAARYGIQSIPTVILFKGGEAVKQFVGVRGKEEYVSALGKL